MGKKTSSSLKKGYVHPLSSEQFFRAGEIHRVPKEWGEEQWIVNKEYCGKKLILKKNRRCSLHLHKEKDEVFYVLKGKVKLEVGGKTHMMLPGDFVHIKQGQEHRFTGVEESEIMEFSTTHSEDDSYRKEFSGHAEPERFARQAAIIQKFPTQKILVIGDIMLDRYIAGSVTRISPEAPIPIVHAMREWDMLGGAGNSAKNIQVLKASVVLVGAVGNDTAGKRAQKFGKEQNIKTVFFSHRGYITTQKERIVNQAGQQIVRVDREITSDIPSDIENDVLKQLPKLVSGMTAVVISDYAKGFLTPKIMKAISVLAKKEKIPLIIDPKPRAGLSLDLLKGATLLTPNVREARDLIGEPHADTERLGKVLSSKTGAAVLLTRGGEGMDLYESGKRTAHFDAHSPAVVDVSGAGDTVAAVAALCLAAGASLADSADIGNRAAGVVVGKQGTATVSSEELRGAL